MIPKLLFLAMLIFFSDQLFANQCRCKTTDENIFSPSECPTESSSPVQAPAILPAMSYRSIEIESFMSVIGQLAGVTVCLSPETTGAITFKSTKLQPWPLIVKSVADQYGLKATISNNLIYISGNIQ